MKILKFLQRLDTKVAGAFVKVTYMPPTSKHCIIFSIWSLPQKMCQIQSPTIPLCTRTPGARSGLHRTPEPPLHVAPPFSHPTVQTEVLSFAAFKQLNGKET